MWWWYYWSNYWSKDWRNTANNFYYINVLMILQWYYKKEKRKLVYMYTHKYMYLLHTLNVAICWVVCTYHYGCVTFPHLRSRKPWGYIPYSWEVLRHEIFVKSLKTGLSCLFVHETTPDIRESQHNYNNTMIIGTIINNINWWCMKWCSQFYFHEDRNLQMFHPLIVTSYMVCKSWIPLSRDTTKCTLVYMQMQY